MLSHLKGELLGMAMLMEKIASDCTHDDALEIAKYDCKHRLHTDGYDTFIKGR